MILFTSLSDMKEKHTLLVLEQQCSTEICKRLSVGHSPKNIAYKNKLHARQKGNLMFVTQRTVGIYYSTCSE